MLEDAVTKFLSRRRVSAIRGTTRRPQPAARPYGLAPYRVVIVGGGVAALETALELQALAGGLVATTIVASEATFTYEPLEVREPFAGVAAPQFALADVATSIGAELVVDRVTRVAPLEHRIFTHGGDALTYDALVLCLGAQPVRRYEHSRTIEPGRLDEVLHGFVQDIEAEYIKSAAFIVPDRVAWPLPLYELLLMTAERAAGMMAEVELTLITSEEQPLEVFGADTSAEIGRRLAAAGVTVVTSAHAEVPGNKRVDVTVDGRRTQLRVDSIVALPELRGPALAGLPADEHGFIPVDPFGLVRGEDRVFAAGDATDGVVKQGGVAAQQAEVVALGVAQLAGAPVEPRPLVPEPRGVLFTGGAPVAVGVPADGGGADGSGTADPAPLRKIAAPRLAAYLAAHPAPAPTAQPRP